MSEVTLFEGSRITKTSKEIVNDVVSLLKHVGLFEEMNELSVSDMATRFVQEMSISYGKDVDAVKDRISNVLSAHLKKKVNGKQVDNPDSLVVRVKNNKGGFKKGVYKLRPKKQPKDIIKVDSLSENTQKKETFKAEEGVSTINIGKGGEMAVMSELLFRGYNPALAVVDNGIDVFATRGKGFFQFQVKTTEWKNNQATVHVDKNSFARYNTSNTYYIVVIRYMINKIWTNQYFIFSSADIQKLIHTGYIAINEKNYSIKLAQEAGDIKAVNKGTKTSVLYHLDNWKLVSE